MAILNGLLKLIGGHLRAADGDSGAFGARGGSKVGQHLRATMGSSFSDSASPLHGRKCGGLTLMDVAK